MNLMNSEKQRSMLMPPWKIHLLNRLSFLCSFRSRLSTREKSQWSVLNRLFYRLIRISLGFRHKKSQNSQHMISLFLTNTTQMN